MSERFIAFKILVKLLKKNTKLSILLDKETTTPFVKELCFGFCRQYFRLNAIYKYYVKKPVKEVEIFVLILLGLYQLKYMRVAEYAAVQETVELLVKLKKPWAKALVNAVLRKFIKDKDKIDWFLNEDPEYKYGLPLWMIDKFKKDIKDFEVFANSLENLSPMSLRVNKRLHSVDNYKKLLKDSGIIAQVSSYVDTALILEKPCKVEDLPEFDKGACYIQDLGAQLAIPLLELEDNLRVLDACAAPGGKAIHIIEASPRTKLVALDLDENRQKRTQENIKRFGYNIDLLCADALNPGSWWDGELFDRILLDAPCSALGVMKRHPDIKILRSVAELENIIKVQALMLEVLWPLLKPGGILLYATCSILSSENTEQIKKFLAKHDDCFCKKINLSFGLKTEFGLQILPQDLGSDGFFYSVLVKRLS